MFVLYVIFILFFIFVSLTFSISWSSKTSFWDAPALSVGHVFKRNLMARTATDGSREAYEVKHVTRLAWYDDSNGCPSAGLEVMTS